MKEKLLSALAHASERCELQQKVESSVGRVFGIVNKWPPVSKLESCLQLVSLGLLILKNKIQNQVDSQYLKNLRDTPVFIKEKPAKISGVLSSWLFDFL